MATQLVRRIAAHAPVITVIAAIIVAGSVTDAFGAATGTGFEPCVTDSGLTHLQYESVSQVDPPRWDITGIRVGGLSGCDGASVRIVLRGNTDGAPSERATNLLAIYDSTRDPCGGAVLTNPPTVQANEITLSACPTGGPGGYASLHDLTQVSTTINGNAVQTAVLGETFTKGTATGKPQSPSFLHTTEQLPFTGSWAALTFWIGIFTLGAGLFFLLVARRLRRNQPASSPPTSPRKP